MNRKIVIILATLAAVALGFYAYLGGFNAPEITRATSRTMIVAGKYYAGPAEGKQLGSLFQQAAKALESKQLSGTLTNIYDNNPQERGDTIRAFIGVAVSDSLVSLPAGYTIRTLSGGKPILQVASDAHFLLAPNKIYPALFEHLQEKKLQVKEPYLEQFPEKGPARVWVEILP